MGKDKIKKIHKYLDEHDNCIPEALVSKIKEDFNLSLIEALEIYLSWKKQYLVPKIKVNYFGRCGRKHI